MKTDHEKGTTRELGFMVTQEELNLWTMLGPFN